MERERRVYQIGATLLLAATLSGFGLVSHSQASSSRGVLAAPMKKVVIKESNERYHYTPATITVTKGTKVTWTNMTDTEHNVSASQGVKIDKDIEKGKTVSLTFTKRGTFRYHCEYHPYMKGTIVVK